MIESLLWMCYRLTSMRLDVGNFDIFHSVFAIFQHACVTFVIIKTIKLFFQRDIRP